MYPELREERIHGTKEFPFSCYHLHDMPAFFQIPVHWHPEVEIIYVRSGSLNVIIEGGPCSYTADKSVFHAALDRSFWSPSG